MAGSDSLNVRFWPPIFQRPPWHFSALEVVFPSFSVFSCISIGVFRRPLSLQCPCTDAVFLGFSAKIDLRGPESSWRESKISGPALPLNGHLRKTLPAVGFAFLKPEILVLEPVFCGVFENALPSPRALPHVPFLMHPFSDSRRRPKSFGVSTKIVRIVAP